MIRLECLIKMRFVFFLIVFIFCQANSIYAEQNSVLILPFEINSAENLDYLKKEIPEIISRNLKQNGIKVIKADIDKNLLKPGDIRQIQKTGLKNGADYVIWGSLTWIGQDISLDGKIIKSISSGYPDNIYSQGKGIESLLQIVNEISEGFIKKLIKRVEISDIIIKGNKLIETNAILRLIKSKPGDILVRNKLSEDLKSIYRMGYFEDIQVEIDNDLKKDSLNKIVIFNIKEKFVIKKIILTGYKVIKAEEIRENMTIKSGSILNIFKINDNINRIKDLYRKENYHNCKISFRIEELENNQAELEIIIDESKKVRIEKLIFNGNTIYTDFELKSMINASDRNYNFFVSLFGYNELDKDKLNMDVNSIKAAYQNNGYMDANVGEPVIDYKEDGIYITFNIEEGRRFKIGKVDFDGDLIIPEDKLMDMIKIKDQEYFNREIFQKDIITLTDFYSDDGFAFVRIIPNDKKNLTDHMVDITFEITKGPLVYFDKINITGNTVTRDKVTRRQLKLYEKELFSGKKLKQGIRSLYRLDYFKDIKVDTSKGRTSDSMNLDINVVEKETGMITFGAGYSSSDAFFGKASVTKRNLFGRGQSLSLTGEFSASRTKYFLNFQEPWLFDIPLSTSVELYNLYKTYSLSGYSKDSIGGSVSAGYRIFDYTRIYTALAHDTSDYIIDDEDEVPDSIIDLEGIQVTNSIKPSIIYDSTDNRLNPSDGFHHSFSVKYAGDQMGGDIAYTQYSIRTSAYFSPFDSFILGISARAGWVYENNGGKLPDDELYKLGGPYSLRGFERYDIHFDDTNSEGDDVNVGGHKFVQFNVELILPLIKEAGMFFVLFYDAGNIFGKYENKDDYDDDTAIEYHDIDLGKLRTCAGFGIRWFSPVGPIRFEWGYILDEKKGEDSAGFQFSMGGSF